MFISLSPWQFPLSLILSLTFLLGSFCLWRFLPRQSCVGRVLRNRWMSIVSILCIMIMLMVEGTWSVMLHRTYVFWAVALVMMLSLLFAMFDGVAQRRPYSVLVSHAGFFLVCFGAFFGAPDVEDVRMLAFRNVKENITYTREGRVSMLPFKVTLKQFSIDFYEDGYSPKQYTSVLDIDGERYETSVNNPCYHRGYFIYQSDFDHERGEYSVLSLVADPWLPVVYIGLLLMAIGALLRMRMDWHSGYVIVAMLVVAVLFTIISVARINFGTLMPALRSWWFVPHLVFYMLAYSSLALALILALVASYSLRREKLKSLASKLFNTSSSLLLLGMLCGAVWAKAAWGDWWTWDSKECWAAVTWLLTLVGVHLPSRLMRKEWAFLMVALLAFAAMQVAWYGVDYLPASHNSMHSYK